MNENKSLLDKIEIMEQLITEKDNEKNNIHKIIESEISKFEEKEQSIRNEFDKKLNELKLNQTDEVTKLIEEKKVTNESKIKLFSEIERYKSEIENIVNK